jgi:hypothetical protein
MKHADLSLPLKSAQALFFIAAAQHHAHPQASTLCSYER